jgi:hypothetical protein
MTPVLEARQLAKTYDPGPAGHPHPHRRRAPLRLTATTVTETGGRGESEMIAAVSVEPGIERSRAGG